MQTQSSQQLLGQGSRIYSFKKATRLGAAFLVASLITGANWLIQSRIASLKQSKQNQIIKRINSNKTCQITDLYNIDQLGNLEGTKVKVTGELQPGRFIIKRKRGDQQGYIVLAPFIFNKYAEGNIRFNRTNNQKFMLNLGWIPKQSKHKVKQAAAIDVLAFDDLPDQLATDEDAPARSTITAYVRRGQQRDILRGYNNWRNEKLFKFIDLGLAEQMFNTTHYSFRHVYLDRIGQQGDQSFPFPTNANNYIDELKQEQKFNNKKKNIYTVGVGVASFVSAALITLL